MKKKGLRTWLKDSLGNESSESFSDWIADFSAFVDNNLDNFFKMTHGVFDV